MPGNLTMRSVTLVLVLGALEAAEIVVKTSRGGTETLRCGITNTAESELTWKKDEKQLYKTNPRSGMHIKANGDFMKRYHLRNDKNLEISHITPQDTGPFTCSANHQEERHRLVIVSVSVSPSGRLEVGSSAVLQCDVFGLPQGSAVEWRRPRGAHERTPTLSINTVTLEDAGPWECVYSIDGTTMTETLTLLVTEPHRESTTAPSTTRTTENNMATSSDWGDLPTRGPPAPVGLSWWVWVAVGGGILVLLLWVLILVLYNKMKRRRRRFMKMRKADHLRLNQFCQCPGGPAAAAQGHRGKRPSPPLAAPVRSVL